MFIIGLTGGIGSGKSTVSDLFSKLGICVVDADLAARVVVEPGQPALIAITNHFGAEVIQTDGSLDRKKLRAKVFDDEAERKWLEALLHPLIREQIESELAAAKSPYAILASPLLLETDQHRLVDRILVVDLPEVTQLQRALTRDASNEQQIKAIMAAQIGRQPRLDRADDIISNEADIKSLESKVLSLHQQYLKQASDKHD